MQPYSINQGERIWESTACLAPAEYSCSRGQQVLLILELVKHRLKKRITIRLVKHQDASPICGCSLRAFIEEYFREDDLADDGSGGSGQGGKEAAVEDAARVRADIRQADSRAISPFNRNFL